jgi:hypothetical protein
MDLYGSGVSIAQGNAQTEAARQLNEASRDFNNSLAEQLDESNLEQDEDRTSKLQKNILSGATSGGKLISKRAALKEGAKLGFKEVKTSLAERVGQESSDRFVARSALRAAEDRTGAAGVFAGEDVFSAAEEEARRFGGGVRDTGLQSTLREGERATAEIDESAEATSDLAGGVETGTEARTALKEGAEDVGKFLGKAKTFGKIGVAGLGGGIDAFQDIGRLVSGQKGLDVFGSNNAARVGNIGNILGSTLEVAGVATGGVTPWSLALETAGAGISLISSVTEAGGELEAGEESKEKAQKDITSQARGQVTAESVEQAVGRTQ